jgi:hypothetical protein
MVSSSLTPRRAILAGGVGGLAILLVVGVGVARAEVVRSASVMEAAPEVASMKVTEGSLVAGEKLTLTGIHLSSVTAITFDKVEAIDVEVIDDDTVIATVPPVPDYQPATVSVEVFAGRDEVQASEPLTYTYAPATAVDRQMEYLFAHWNNYNVAEWGDLNSIGGDCMNFVSQSLLARGWAMTDEWYSYDAGSDWGDAWGHVPSFDEWLRAHPEYGASTLSFDQRDQVKIGDLVVFDWDGDGSLDHIQVVSSITVVDGVTKIGMVGHNLDSDYRDLDTVITVDHPGATGYFWSIP